MVYRVATQNGAELSIHAYTAGSAMAAGDLVALAADDQVDTVAANATAVLGWVTGTVSADDVANGRTVNVLEANDNTVVEMPFTGTPAPGMLGGYFGLTGTTGAQKVNLGDTTNKLFKLLRITRNGTATGNAADDFRCLVLVPSSKSQAVIEA